MRKMNALPGIVFINLPVLASPDMTEEAILAEEQRWGIGVVIVFCNKALHICLPRGL